MEAIKNSSICYSSLFHCEYHTNTIESYLKSADGIIVDEKFPDDLMTKCEAVMKFFLKIFQM